MSYLYVCPLKVPTWVVIDPKSDKVEQATKWFKHHLALEQPWPAHQYGQQVESMSKKGWSIPNYPFIMDPDLMQRAAIELFSKMFNENVRVQLTCANHHINRKITCFEDYERLMNEYLLKQDHTTLSQIFMIGERCYDSYNKKKITLFFSVGPIPGEVLNLLANKIITVGDGPQFSIDLSAGGRVSSILDKFFSDPG